MSRSLSFQIPKALPSVCQSQRKNPSISILCTLKQFPNCKPYKAPPTVSRKIIDSVGPKISGLAIQIGAILGTVAQPAYAVTGVNNEEDFTSVLIELGISAFFYFLVAPPIIMNWLRIRWYRRKLLEMYVQFMFVFMFFPGLLLWAPFLNFRKFPRDPSMKYPWSTPEDLSKVRDPVLKYPWATPEDYD